MNSATPKSESLPDLDARWRQLAGLAAAVLLAMLLWFSATAVSPQLTDAWSLNDSQQSWLTISVQLGFVAGTVISAGLNLADRFPVNRLMSVCALLGAASNAWIALGVSDEMGATALGFGLVLALRFLTGLALAGVYPPGMKLMASWFRSGRGLAIGLMVGALTIGSASPHLLSAPLDRWSAVAGGVAPWRTVMLAASLAAAAAALIAVLFLRSGPLLGKSAPFDWSYGLRMWKDEAVRRANFGYLGHMWELYAMWAWAPRFIASSYEMAGWSVESARTVGFLTVAIGGVGCVAAGYLADMWGRTTLTIASLVISGACALSAGFLHDAPLAVTAVCLLWGLSVVADSAQFSTAVTELADPKYVGTALTVQTCAGFLLTNITIRLVPVIERQSGWGWAFAILALGPVFGIWHMLRLRHMPESRKLAGGNR